MSDLPQEELSKIKTNKNSDLFILYILKDIQFYNLISVVKISHNLLNIMIIRINVLLQ